SRLLAENPEMQTAQQYDATLHTLLDGMSSSITRMQGIVNEILLVSRIMTDRIELVIGPTDLGDIARKAIFAYKDAFQERHLTVHFDRASFPQQMQADWE